MLIFVLQASAATPLLPNAPSTVQESTHQPPQTSAQELSDAIVVGIINTIVSLPCTLAYVAIMFPSKRFIPFMPALSRLVFLGSAIHQVTFSCLSSLPFAIGQVQDVGLIFLSAMSTSVTSLLPVSGETEEEQAATERLMVTTTLLAMTLSTAITGVLLIIVGKCGHPPLPPSPVLLPCLQHSLWHAFVTCVRLPPLASVLPHRACNA